MPTFCTPTADFLHAYKVTCKPAAAAMSGTDYPIITDYVNLLRNIASAPISIAARLIAALEEIDSPLDVNAALERQDQLEGFTKLPPVVLNQIFSTLSCDNIVKLTRVNKELRNYIAANIRSIYANMRRKDKYLPVIEWDKIDASNREVKKQMDAGMSLEDAITAAKMHAFREVCAIPNYFLRLGEDTLKALYPKAASLSLRRLYGTPIEYGKLIAPHLGLFPSRAFLRRAFNQYLYLLNHGINPKTAFDYCNTSTPVEAIRIVSDANVMLDNDDLIGEDEFWEKYRNLNNTRFYAEKVVPLGPKAAQVYIDSLMDGHSIDYAFDAAIAATPTVERRDDEDHSWSTGATGVNYRYLDDGLHRYDPQKMEKWPEPPALPPNTYFDPLAAETELH